MNISPVTTFRTRSRRSWGLGALVCALLVLAGVGAAVAELTFPALTGRVVDAAKILTPATRTALEAKLATQEAMVTDQFVVATIPSLQDTSIEDYANKLFRFWKLGQAKENNGVLLLVAPAERKVRIEVGYGLEGILTDAVSDTIIRTAIIPSFKAGDMPAGIVKGADAILEILNLDPEEARQRAKDAAAGATADGDDWEQFLILAVMVIIFLVIIYFSIRNGGGGGGRRRGAWIGSTAATGSSWSWGSSSGSSSSDSGGFSGGGGSSGGGGASGSW